MKTPRSSLPSATPEAGKGNWIAALAEPAKIEMLGPIAARFIYSLRLIALHERARQDPVPELAVRLGNVSAASRSLSLAQAISRTWPENIHVARFCCRMLSHDEACIGAMIDHATARSRIEFGRELGGLVRPERIAELWDRTQALILAESHG